MSRHFETPYFIMYKERLKKNLTQLKKLEILANVKILHTLKSFNEHTTLPLITKELSGISISSKKEFQMAKKASAKHIHLYAPAFKKKEFLTYMNDVQSISFNSLGQWKYFKDYAKETSKGLRINPKLQLPIPNHCNPNLEYSRLGIDTEIFLEAYTKEQKDFEELEGLHFHALFQNNIDSLVLLLDYILTHYKKILPTLKWLNLGGGNNFTSLNYDIDTFVKYLIKFQELYPKIKFYFEPGEAITKDCGEFACTVLDIINIDEKNVVILDTSIETHLLDVAIVHMKLKVRDTQNKPTPYDYELAGNSCLQGDIIGRYFFTKELLIGDHVLFEDMIPYTMVKMTEFNGMEKANFYLV